MADLDAIIAEGVATSTENAQSETSSEATTEQAQEGEQTETKTEEKPAKQPWPKEAENALSRAKGDRARYKAERDFNKQRAEQLEKELADYKKPKAENTGEPQEADFEGKPYGVYLKAVARWEAKQTFEQTKAEETKAKAETSARDWEQERAQAINDNHVIAEKAFPDFKDTMDGAADDNGKIPLSPDLRAAILDSDNGAFALYALIKEGLLDEANDLSSRKAAMLIARMEDKALALSKTKTTKTPTPLSPAKGTATGGKSLETMSGEEIRKWMRSK